MAARAYVFDAYGTLFDVHSAVAGHAPKIGERWPALSDLWRQKQLEYTWIRTLAGHYRDFAEVTADALDFALAAIAPEHKALRQALLDAYRSLDAFPDVADSLARLKQAGARVAILSNGTPDMLAAAVGSAGLSPLIDATYSVDALRAYKTAPQVYAYAASKLGLAAGEISFQSSNRWDIAGAVAFGFRTVWVNRRGQPDEYPDLAPAATIRSLAELPDL